MAKKDALADRVCSYLCSQERICVMCNPPEQSRAAFGIRPRTGQLMQPYCWTVNPRNSMRLSQLCGWPGEFGMGCTSVLVSSSFYRSSWISHSHQVEDHRVGQLQLDVGRQSAAFPMLVSGLHTSWCQWDVLWNLSPVWRDCKHDLIGT